jgi:hypothetical protein
VSSIGLRNLMIPRQLPVLHRHFYLCWHPNRSVIFVG